MRFIALSVLLIFVLTVSVRTRAEQVDEAYTYFQSGQYGQVFSTLLPYRINHEGTLRVDFMLAVSACRQSDPEFTALGGYLLHAIQIWYKPLRDSHQRDIQRWAQSCPWTGISESQAFAMLRAKTDAHGAEQLARERSQAGKDEDLPRAPAGVIVQPPAGFVPPPPPPVMSALIKGQAYPPPDYRDYKGVATAVACSALCANDDGCAAMTYITTQQRCFLKAGTPNIGPGNSDMISAYKLKK